MLGLVPFEVLAGLLLGAALAGVLAIRRGSLDNWRSGFLCLIFLLFLNGFIIMSPFPYGWPLLTGVVVWIGQGLFFFLGVLITPEPTEESKEQGAKNG